MTAAIGNTHWRDNLSFLYTERPKTIRGKITGSSGAIVDGTGFSCSRGSTGTYTITFSTAFTAAPAVEVASVYTGQFRVAFITSRSTTTLVLLILDSGVVPQDNDFVFAAWEANQ